jgi:hydrogenase nickel incorporation protein HypA/HybF
MSLCEAIAGAVNRHAGGKPVTSVLVRIGHLRQVVPDALIFSWQMLSTGTDLEGSVLEVESVPATVSCKACGVETTLDMPIVACGECFSRDVELLTGEEFAVVSLELATVPSGTPEDPG